MANMRFRSARGWERAMQNKIDARQYLYRSSTLRRTCPTSVRYGRRSAAWNASGTGLGMRAHTKGSSELKFLRLCIPKGSESGVYLLIFRIAVFTGAFLAAFLAGLTAFAGTVAEGFGLLTMGGFAPPTIGVSGGASHLTIGGLAPRAVGAALPGMRASISAIGLTCLAAEVLADFMAVT